MEQKIYKTDILIIGKGLAGVRAANAAVRQGVSVTLISKGNGSSTDIMGFNTTIGADDSVEIFYEDTLRSGAYINNRSVALKLAENSNAEIAFLEELGLKFDRNPDGSYNLMQTLGSSCKRMVHYKSLTGAAALNLLLKDCERRGVNFVEPVMTLNLLKDRNGITGASALDLQSGELVFFLAKAVVLATGGCGDIYPLSTYPKGISGDGYVMAYRAGVELMDMEFQQYDPCCFVYPNALRGRIVVTTMLNEGGELYNKNGERFIIDDYGTYNIQKSEIARHIWKEILDGKGNEHGGVYYDVTKLPHDRVAIDHNLFYDPALANGVDLTKVPAEVAPAAHSCVGGLGITPDCASTLPGLFAAGEVAGGIHGANRIGGSAGTEVFVYGRIAGESAASYVKAWDGDLSPALGKEAIERETALFHSRKKAPSSEGADIDGILTQARRTINNGIGIVRDEDSLNSCIRELSGLMQVLDQLSADHTDRLAKIYTLENALVLAQLQAAASLMRTESRGVFYRRDFPEQDDAGWRKNIFIRQDDQENAKLYSLEV